MIILFELPAEEYLTHWRKIKTLVANIEIKGTKFYPNATKQNYINLGFLEVEMGTFHERNYFLPNMIQYKNNIS